MNLTTGFYWDRDEESRAWSKRFQARHKSMPTMSQAGVYSSLMHYFKAVDKAGTDEAHAVMAAMKSMPINDMFAKNGYIRDDGRMIHDMYLVQVKKPSESKGPWDYYKVLRTIPGDEAYISPEKSTCKLLKK